MRIENCNNFFPKNEQYFIFILFSVSILIMYLSLFRIKKLI